MLLLRASHLALFVTALLLSSTTFAQQHHTKETQAIESLEEPLYNPFIERYVIDELKQLRTDMNDLHVDVTKEITNRELAATTRAVSYATDTITYFFYLIAGVSSVLVLVGWNSIRDVKEKVHHLANSKIEEVVTEYEARLEKLEEELNRKSRGITSAQKKLSKHQDIYSLWLKAGQEQILSNKVDIYDQILELEPNNVEALTYKADVVLDMNEPHWAISLCQQALAMEPENKHALYQIASAYALLELNDKALDYLEQSLQGAEGKGQSIHDDPHLKGLREEEKFLELLKTYDSTYSNHS